MNRLEKPTILVVDMLNDFMTGLHAHMCVRHTSADAFCLGYDVVVAKEATDSFTEEDYLNGLAYLKTCYGAEAYTNEELIKAFQS